MSILLKRFGVWILALVLLGVQAGGGAAQEGRPHSATAGALFLPIIMTSSPPQWIGPGGGLIAAVATSPLVSNIVYAGSWGGGVYRSEDGGVTWTWKSQGLTNQTIVSLAVDPSNPNLAYAGTYRGKLFKTTNGGESWLLSSQGIQDQAIVYSIGVDPGNPQRIYAATRGLSNNGSQPWSGVVYRSDDRGATWTSKLYNLGGSNYQDYVYSLTIHPGSPNILFAATHEHGIYRSTNYGDSWQSYNNGITNSSTRAVVTGSYTDYHDDVYTGVWERLGVYKSTNLGVTWALKSYGIAGAHIYSMDIDPVRQSWVYAATFNMGLMRTTDAANSWSNIGLAWESIATVRINQANSNTIFAGTAGDGLFASRDSGSTWQRSQTGLNASSATGLVVSPDDPQTLYAGVYGSGVMRSSDSGLSWADYSQNLGNLLVNGLVEQPQRKVLFAWTEGAGLYRCDLQNLGSCWQRVGTNLPTAAEAGPLLPAGGPFSNRDTFVEAYGVPDDGVPDDGGPSPSVAHPQALPATQGLQALAFAPSNPDVAYIGTNNSGVYKSTNGGLNWTAAGLSGKKVWSLVVDPTNPQVVYAATDQSGEVHMSVNGGGSWADISLPGVTVYSLAVPASNPNLLYAGTSNGIYRRSGSTWSLLGLGGSTIAWITTHPTEAGRVYAGSTNGAFISRNAGISWEAGPGELAGYTVQSISIDPFLPGVMYFCTTMRGVLRAYIH
ncbi:MAG TPA: hypothetical protein VLA49_10455 [Anaerolineales bacterium]|nr:hypothetical protein [Anaerolineales bacterium]